MNKEIDQKLEEFKAMGIELDLDLQNASEEEKLGALEALETFASALDSTDGGLLVPEFKLRKEEECTLDILIDLAKDIDHSPQDIIRQITELAHQPQEGLAEDELFSNTGLYKLYELFGEKSLIMTLDHSDPIEIGRLLNHIFSYHNQAAIDDDYLTAIEDEMFEAEDESEYVWQKLSEEMHKRNIALLNMWPKDGAWSVIALISIKKDHASKWENRGFGKYALLPF